MGSGEGGDYSGKLTRLSSSLWPEGGRVRGGAGKKEGGSEWRRDGWAN